MPMTKEVVMTIKRVARVALFLGLVLNYGLVPATAVPTLSIVPSSQTVPPGQSFALDVTMTDVLDLYAFQFDLEFDPLILSATSVTEGPFLPTGGATAFIPGFIDNTMGNITFIADTLQTAIVGVNGSGTLATVNLQALTLGTSSITLANVILLDSNLGDITSNTVDGSVTVQATAIPEPSTWLLLATGLVGLLAFGGQLRQRAS